MAARKLVFDDQRSAPGILVLGPEAVPDSNSELAATVSFGLVFQEADAELSGGHAVVVLPLGGQPQMSDAEFHRRVQTWWNEHDARLKNRKPDPNLRKPATQRISTAPKPLSTEVTRAVRAGIDDSMAQARLLSQQEIGLDGDEIAAIIMMLDDIEEYA